MIDIDDDEFEYEDERPSYEENERLFEALVAAAEGREGAAKAALGIFLNLNDEFAENLPGARYVAHRRPADYWVHE